MNNKQYCVEGCCFSQNPKIHFDNTGHRWDSLDICIRCNRCKDIECCGFIEECTYGWFGGLPARQPIKLGKGPWVK